MSFLTRINQKNGPNPNKGVRLSTAWSARLRASPDHTKSASLAPTQARALQVPVRQWRRLTALRWSTSTRSDNGHYQVLQLCRCSTLAVEFSGLNWMTKLYWTAIRCYRRVSCAMCFRRSVQLHGRGARGERLTVGIMLPGRQDADDWLNFMFIAEEPMAYLYNSRNSHRGDLWTGLQQRAAQAAGQTSVDGGQTTVGGCLQTGCYVKAPHREVQKKNWMLCSSTGPPDATALTHMKRKRYRGPGIKEVQAWWKQCQDWMAQFKEQGEPVVFNFKKLLKALSGKEAVAQSEVDAFMENCAKKVAD